MIVSEPSNAACSYCGKPLHIAHIVWHLAALSLKLHEGCAKRLAYGLRTNAFKLEQRDLFIDA